MCGFFKTLSPFTVYYARCFAGTKWAFIRRQKNRILRTPTEHSHNVFFYSLIILKFRTVKATGCKHRYKSRVRNVFKILCTLYSTSKYNTHHAPHQQPILVYSTLVHTDWSAVTYKPALDWQSARNSTVSWRDDAVDVSHRQDLSTICRLQHDYRYARTVKAQC